MPVTQKQPPDSVQIRRMFDALAPRYDLFNHLMSFGLASGWRRRALEGLKPGMRVLDVGCGTGDLSLEAARMLEGAGEVTAIDFSEKMLDFARRREAGQVSSGQKRAPIRWVLKKAEELPIDEGSFDLVVSGFVLRNVYENTDRILRGARDSLKTGGRISLLDFTEPPNGVMKDVWRFYMNTVAAFYGRILFGKDYPEFYLTESADRFSKPSEFERRMREAGFKEVGTSLMMFGVIVLYQGVK